MKPPPEKEDLKKYLTIWVLPFMMGVKVDEGGRENAGL